MTTARGSRGAGRGSEGAGGMVKPTYIACVSDGENEYHVGFYKTFGGARRAITRMWPYFGLGKPMKHWAIERDSNLGLEGRHLNGVLAQSYHWPHPSRWVRADNTPFAPLDWLAGEG